MSPASQKTATQTSPASQFRPCVTEDYHPNQPSITIRALRHRKLPLKRGLRHNSTLAPGKKLPFTDLRQPTNQTANQSSTKSKSRASRGNHENSIFRDLEVICIFLFVSRAKRGIWISCLTFAGWLAGWLGAWLAGCRRSVNGIFFFRRQA